MPAAPALLSTVDMDARPLGPILVTLGVVVALAGVLVWTGAFSWFGRLPGDLRIERENVRVFVPFGSMLLISLALTLILNLARRLF